MRNVYAAGWGRHTSLRLRGRPGERLVSSGLLILYNGWAPEVATREPYLYS